MKNLKKGAQFSYEIKKRDGEKCYCQIGIKIDEKKYGWQKSIELGDEIMVSLIKNNSYIPVTTTTWEYDRGYSWLNVENIESVEKYHNDWYVDYDVLDTNMLVYDGDMPVIPDDIQKNISMWDNHIKNNNQNYARNLFK